MSEQKDPARAQIDESTRQRMIDGDLSNMSYFDAAVELVSDQDKIATNRTVDAVEKLVNDNAGFFFAFKSEFIQELEKLRR